MKSAARLSRFTLGSPRYFVSRLPLQFFSGVVPTTRRRIQEMLQLKTGTMWRVSQIVYQLDTARKWSRLRLRLALPSHLGWSINQSIRPVNRYRHPDYTSRESIDQTRWPFRVGYRQAARLGFRLLVQFLHQQPHQCGEQAGERR